MGSGDPTGVAASGVHVMINASSMQHCINEALIFSAVDYRSYFPVGKRLASGSVRLMLVSWYVVSPTRGSVRFE